MSRFVHLLLPLCACAARVEPRSLVTAEQAAAAPMDLGSRGTTESANGPAIVLRSPTHDGTYEGTFDIDLSFEPGPTGLPFNPASLKITYLRGWGFDITKHFREFLVDGRLSYAGATMPPGRHSVEVYAEDTDGNASTRVFTIEMR